MIKKRLIHLLNLKFSGLINGLFSFPPTRRNCYTSDEFKPQYYNTVFLIMIMNIILFIIIIMIIVIIIIKIKIKSIALKKLKRLVLKLA